MAVTANFSSDHVSAAPGEAATLTLHLHNPTEAERMVKLRAVGEFASTVVLQSETIYLDPDEVFDVPVVVDPSSDLVAGEHVCTLQIDDAGTTSEASVTVDLEPAVSFDARLEPQESRSGRAGRHKIVVVNTGNVPIAVELDVTASDDVVAEIAVPVVNVDPGATAKVELKLSPHSRYWTGVEIEHPFAVGLVASDGETVSLDGTYRQAPRVGSWVAPALAGLLGALLLGLLAWFLLLRPAVRNIAEDEAAELDAVQDAAIAEQVAEMQRAAAEAAELPLGEPVDLRLTTAPTGGSSDTDAFTFDAGGSGRILSLTDVIIQNPGGATGTVQLLRGDDVLLESSLANFRDLEFHLVAPLRFASGTNVSLSVACSEPGPGSTTCDVAATVVGFVDDA